MPKLIEGVVPASNPSSGARVLTRTDRSTVDGEVGAFGVPNYQRVRDAIRADIARGRLAPNARLKLRELTARYGLSPAPIREALSQLAAEGWVIIHPNRGVQVREIDEAFFREMNEVRIALESYTIGLCAAVATPGDVDLLEAIEDEYERVLVEVCGKDREVPSDGGVEAFPLVQINARFHKAIRAIHPNREAASLIERYNTFFHTMRLAWGYGGSRPRQMATEHRALLAAFRNNDASAAECVCRDHVANAMKDLLEMWRKGNRG